MFLLGEDGDAFGGEDGGDAHLPQEVLHAAAEDLAKLVQIQARQSLDLLPELRQVLGQLFRGEELDQQCCVHILAASFGVDQSDGVVKDGQD